MIMVITAIAGTGFWGIKVLGFLPLRYCPLVFGTICALWSFPPILSEILFEGKGKNGSTVAGTSVITPIIPLLFVLYGAFRQFLMKSCLKGKEKMDRQLL